VATNSTKAPWALSVQFLKGVGEKLASLFRKVQIESYWDLLFHLPRAYEDRRRFCNFKDIVESVEKNLPVLGQAIIEAYVHRRAPGGRSWLEATVRVLDPKESSSVTHYLTFVWFHESRFIEKSFPVGSVVLFQGKAQSFRGRLQMAHPQLQKTEKDMAPWEFGKIVPVYPEIMGVSTRVIRKIQYQALMRPELDSIPETLPKGMAESLKLPALPESLREIHFPQKWDAPLGNDVENESVSSPFYRRLAFEELFYLSLALSLRSQAKLMQSFETPLKVPKVQEKATEKIGWLTQLPFALTEAQKKALSEISSDMTEAEKPMHRLLQGDVGSGKTIVAFLSMLQATSSGYTSVMMAPTELLADQHYRNFIKLFPEWADKIVLLKGSLTEKEKLATKRELSFGKARIAIGTQALLFAENIFQDLALVVIDEQHRFGVKQRLALKKLSLEWEPHLLVMTATPIPRSLALTLYGDLKLSQIREKPKGRQPIRTHLLREKSRDKLVERLKGFLSEGRQIYMVYPLVEENEELDLKDVQRAHQEWGSIFTGFRVALLHGQMKAQEKDRAMREFVEGRAQVLVATTVIEVGIDVPRASVMVIEHAERFGLSQLHQLRGRVGRGDIESFCILVTPDWLGEKSYERLSIMEKTDDGFVIAEKDLELRGPGEFLGQRQSGLPQFRVAHLLRDVEILDEARKKSQELLLGDPLLKKPENAFVKEHLMRWWGTKFELSLSG
jgi:ATP-dependent DNA helicase RecG